MARSQLYDIIQEGEIMKRHRLHILTVIAAIFLMFHLSGCPGGKGVDDMSDITITCSPADGSASVALDVSITATFSGAITVPSDWMGSFILRKDNSGDNLCTGVTYSEGNLVAECAHVNFAEDSSYTITLSGLEDADGKDIGTAAATFTTAALLPSVSAVTVTLSPSDGASDVALDQAVTATFSGAITEPSDWAGVFVLRKNNIGDTLCTQVTYDSNTLIAKCIHESFEFGASYTSVVSGAKDAEGGDIGTAAATFSSAGLGVSHVTKTSVISTLGPNDVDITFHFGSAVPDGMTPTVGVTGSDPTVGNCSFNAGRTAYTCTVSNVDGCATLHDYTVSLGGSGFADFSATFNSADDEFDWSGTPIANMIGAAGTCWIRDSQFMVNESVANGVFEMSFPGGAGAGESVFHKVFDGDFACSIYIAANNFPASGNSNLTYGLFIFADESMKYFREGLGTTWFLENSIGRAKPTGELADTAGHAAPFYVCMVKYQGLMKVYVSTAEGEPYTELTSDNLICEGCDVGDFLNLDYSSPNPVNIELNVRRLAGASLYEAQLGYVRFKATGLTGTVDDCPPIP